MKPNTAKLFFICLFIGFAGISQGQALSGSYADADYLQKQEIAKEALLCLTASASEVELTSSAKATCEPLLEKYYWSLKTFEERRDFLRMSNHQELADNIVNIERCTVEVLNADHALIMPDYCLRLYSNKYFSNLDGVRPVYLSLPEGSFWIKNNQVIDPIKN